MMTLAWQGGGCGWWFGRYWDDVGQDSASHLNVLQWCLGALGWGCLVAGPHIGLAQGEQDVQACSPGATCAGWPSPQVDRRRCFRRLGRRCQAGWRTLPPATPPLARSRRGGGRFWGTAEASARTLGVTATVSMWARQPAGGAHHQRALQGPCVSEGACSAGTPYVALAQFPWCSSHP